jgi:hypothetical protein
MSPTAAAAALDRLSTRSRIMGQPRSHSSARRLKCAGLRSLTLLPWPMFMGARVDSSGHAIVDTRSYSGAKRLVPAV